MDVKPEVGAEGGVRPGAYVSFFFVSLGFLLSGNVFEWSTLRLNFVGWQA